MYVTKIKIGIHRIETSCIEVTMSGKGRYFFVATEFFTLHLAAYLQPSTCSLALACFLVTDGGEWSLPSWHHLFRPSGRTVNLTSQASPLSCVLFSYLILFCPRPLHFRFALWGCSGFKRWVLGKAWRWRMLGDGTFSRMTGTGASENRCSSSSYSESIKMRLCSAASLPTPTLTEELLPFSKWFSVCFRTIIYSEVNCKIIELQRTLDRLK